MRGNAHLGVAFFAYSLVSLGLLKLVEPSTKQILIGLAAAFLVSGLPDRDFNVPFIKHRSVLSHSLFFAVIYSAVIGYFNLYAGVGILVGLVSHISLDLVNYQGFEVLFPLSRKNYSLGWVSANNKVLNRSLFLGGFIGGVLILAFYL